MCYIMYGDMMIEYIRKTLDNQIQIARDGSVDYQDRTFQKVMNDLLKKQLTNLDAREKTTMKIFSFTSKSPIYIDSKNLLLCIRSYRMQRSLYVNYHAIRDYRSYEKDIIISFYNAHEFRIEEKYAFLSQIKKAIVILEFLKQ